MWQALLVLLVIVLAVALSKGRAGTPFVITPREQAAVTISGGRWRRKIAKITR